MEFTHVMVASDNPLKIEIARRAFKKIFPDKLFSINGIKSVSGVPEQPMSNAETLRGAKNRLAYIEGINAKEDSQYEPADYLISMEGGVENRSVNELVEFAHILVKDMKTENVGWAKTVEFRVPKPIADIVRSGGEIGPAADKVFGTENCKQHSGSIPLFTDGVIDRQSVYIQAALFAINELKHPEWFFPE